ncbi:MAG: hypothetical protein J0H54_03645 [Rhizobiales bacterium]|nr:hypothetical protein [Hyphomicrobiales bacterium]
MGHLFATAGAKLHIGGALAFDGTDFSASSFSGQSWTEIKALSSLGSLGDAAEMISFNEIGAERTRKLKGTRNAGQMQIVAGLDYADPGQLALIAAEKTDATYAFRLVFDDAPSGGTPSERLFTALVISATEQLDEANSVVTLNATLEIDSNIVRVSAAA